MSDSTDTPSTFPIVAVGASAGGVGPTGELLHELGAGPGIALVIIHHLDPTHESSLVDILSRASALPVANATEGTRVEPNHVYVIPPNAGLLIGQGVLKLVPRTEAGGLHLPINRFFESLALDRDGLAAGVVLSGSGFDGTEGIKALKREGGITFAQDATAEYGSMPESAIATGCVDFILPPAGLARELRRLGTQAPSVRTAPQSGAEEHDYTQILEAMRRASGVDFASYKHATIRRRLERRLFFRGLSDLSAYLELLKRDRAEVAALCEEALIHVTGFFRDPEAFEALRTHVFPKLCERRLRDAPIRIWVPGCSTGEEVYSIAICLREFLADAPREPPIKIFGTDLSDSVIDKARAGRFPESIQGEVSAERLRTCFTKTEGGYQIRRDLRDLCVFARHDVARDPPFAAMDLISCRNLMIYLGHELQGRVIALLHYALNEPGFLLLGSSETVRAFPGFAAVDGKHKIYARTSAAPRLAFDFTTPRHPVGRPSAGPEAASSPDSGSRAPAASEVHREADRLVLAEFSPPGVLVTDDLAVIQFRGSTGPFLEHAPGVASLDLLRTAREELRLPLRRAIDQARSTASPTRQAGIVLLVGDKRRTIDLEVIPFSVHATRQRFFLVLFEDVTPAEGAAEPAVALPAEGADEAAERALQQELSSTRQYLESLVEQLEATNEELRAANEEVVSSNEELRSTNEELQSAKEEVQATNEELRTVNDEMRDRSAEATRLSDDLTNVLTSIEIPILLVGRDLRLRRFTPAAAKLFGLLATDLGRAVSDVPRIVATAPAIAGTISDVVAQLQPAESTLQDALGHWYDFSVRPYVTLDGRVDGAVIAARDVDTQKKGAERLEAARAYAQGIVDTVREGLVVLDRDLRVASANKAFLRAFRLSPESIAGRRLEELGHPLLAAPRLLNVLQDLDAVATIEGFRLEQTEGAGSPRAFVLNARRIESTERLLLAFEDVTLAIQFRDALAGAAEGVLMVDMAGQIRFANHAAAATFGYQGEELLGFSVDRLLPDPLREFFAEQPASDAAAAAPRLVVRSREALGRRKDGKEVPVVVTLSAVEQVEGPIVVVFVTDITERKAIEKQIRTYQEELRRMAFDAAVTEERERRRIATELHDRMGQALALAQIKLSSVRGQLAGEVRSAVDGAVELVEQAIGDTRTLIFDLSPPILYDLGLQQALAWLAEDLEKRHGITIEVEDDGASKPLDDAAKGVVFRAVRELLMNVLKHAQAPAAKVSLVRSGDHCRIDVEDRGAGFDPDTTTAGRAGFGLLSVRSQIGRLGGVLDVRSAPGRGTLASVRVPLRTETEAADPGEREAPSAEQTP